MSDSPRGRINAAFDQELEASPVPDGLRAISIRTAVAAPSRDPRRPQLLALVAAVLALALIATLVVAHGLRPNVVPAYSPVPPPGRAGASVTYDERHGAMVVFGGSGTKVLDETWTWDGRGWIQRHPATSPAPRHDALMAYDAARHEVVLFGGAAQDNIGKGGQASASDTWIWNGSTWLQKHPRHVPSIAPEWMPSMQYDPITRTVLLFGFTRATTEAMTDMKPQTWTWSGTDWFQLSPSSSAVVPATMVSDGTRILLLAGSTYVAGRYITQTWAWDGANWNLLHPNVNLPESGLAYGAYDPARGQLVVLNGDTWTWDGTSWGRQHPSLQPQSVGYMAYVPSMHAVVSWGDRYSRDNADMYAWDGTNWKLVLSPGAPTTPKVAITDGKGGYRVPMTADQAAALIRAKVTNTHPVLLPSTLPGGPYDAMVSAAADGFSIEYRSDLRDRTIYFGIVVANPPPAGPSSQSSTVKFRHALATKGTPAGYADYVVYDRSVSLSNRYLEWMEPGTMANPQLADPGVPYFLSTSGLTDQEFWQIANSLQ